MRLAFVTITGCRSHSAVQIKPKTQPSNGVINVVLETVRFTANGEDGGIEAGAAMRIESCEEGSCTQPVIELSRCRFDRNRAEIGGALYARDAKIHINNSVFEKNEASLSGGALYLGNTDDAALIVEDSAFRENGAWGRDEIRETNASVLLPSTRDISNMSGMGGAVFAHDPGQLSVRSTNFTGNSGCRGGGAIAVIQVAAGGANNGTHTFIISHALFEGNAAYCVPKDASRLDDVHGLMYYGGALMQQSAGVAVHNWTVIHSTFRRNHAALGGAISFRSHLMSDVEQSVISCDFDGNIALVGGGAVLVDTTRLKIMRSEIRNGRSIAGGGLIVRLNAVLTIVHDPENPSADSSIEGNIGIYGGGLFVTSGSN